MNAETSRRLARALDLGHATLEERQVLVDAAQVAETFDELPPGARLLVERLERAPTK